MSDFSYILRSLEASGLEDHKNLSSRCLLHIIEQRLILLDSPFWTTPCPYSTEYFLRHDVWTEELSKSSLIIFKGDLNYRKVWQDSYLAYFDIFYFIVLNQFSLSPISDGAAEPRYEQLLGNLDLVEKRPRFYR